VFQLIASLFGCTHHRCTFPMTARKAAGKIAGKPSPKTYVVCLDCGKEFAYDWQRMKKTATPRVA
jgi:hypothetical protein